MTAFKRVSEMNEAFGNPKGNPDDINWTRIRSQCKNIHDEYLELLAGLGLAPAFVQSIRANFNDNFDQQAFSHAPDVVAVRDALADIQVFKDGALHLMGYNGDNDMDDVVDGVMTRFVKNKEDKDATIALHAAKGVTEVYFEGKYPKMVMKSAVDQPDAPKGKFLKSASYSDTIFRNAP